MKIVGLIMIFLLSVISVQAATVTFDVEKVQDKVALGGEAVFTGVIFNDDSKGHLFRFVIEDSDWQIETRPRLLFVGAQETERFDLRLKPLKNRDTGKYSVPIIAISNVDDSVRVKKQPTVQFLDYNDFLDVNVDFPGDFDPGSSNIARVTIKNNEDVNLKNLTLKLDSRYFSGAKEGVNLGRKDSKTINLDLEFQTGYKEGVYNVDVMLLVSDEIVYQNEEQAKIAYIPLGSEIRSPESGFLMSKTAITKVNEGDVFIDDSYKKRVSYFESWFTSYNTEPDSVNEVTGGYLYEWNFELGPGDSESVVITTDYRFLAIAIILLVIVVAIVVAFFRRELSVKKKVISLIKGKEGTSTFGVLIQIRNKSRRELRNVRIMDTITNLSEFDNIHYNTLEPKIKKRTGAVANLIWELDRMQSGKELSISFDVRASMKKTSSMFSLPTRARYIDKKGKWKNVSSEGKLV